jgi:hypothetical protein
MLINTVPCHGHAVVEMHVWSKGDHPILIKYPKLLAPSLLGDILPVVILSLGTQKAPSFSKVLLVEKKVQIVIFKFSFFLSCENKSSLV